MSRWATSSDCAPRPRVRARRSSPPHASRRQGPPCGVYHLRDRICRAGAGCLSLKPYSYHLSVASSMTSRFPRGRSRCSFWLPVSNCMESDGRPHAPPSAEALRGDDWDWAAAGAIASPSAVLLFMKRRRSTRLSSDDQIENESGNMGPRPRPTASARPAPPPVIAAASVRARGRIPRPSSGCRGFVRPRVRVLAPAMVSRFCSTSKVVGPASFTTTVSVPLPWVLKVSIVAGLNAAPSEAPASVQGLDDLVVLRAQNHHRGSGRLWCGRHARVASGYEENVVLDIHREAREAVAFVAEVVVGRHHHGFGGRDDGDALRRIAVDIDVAPCHRKRVRRRDRSCQGLNFASYHGDAARRG